MGLLSGLSENELEEYRALLDNAELGFEEKEE